MCITFNNIYYVVILFYVFKKFNTSQMTYTKNLYREVLLEFLFYG